MTPRPHTGGTGSPPMPGTRAGSMVQGLPDADPRSAVGRASEVRLGPPLLTAKLAPPPLGFDPLPRPRLFDLISRAVAAAPVTLLSGPAGSGKTVLAGSWMRAQEGRRTVGWLTLDETEDDPAAFWPYVLAALTAAGSEVGDLPDPVPGRQNSPTVAVELAARLSALPQPVVLILDNADRLTDRSVRSALDLLIRYGGRWLRLVLCARTDPLLPLHRYRPSADTGAPRRASRAWVSLAVNASRSVRISASMSAGRYRCRGSNGSVRAQSTCLLYTSPSPRD